MPVTDRDHQAATVRQSPVLEQQQSRAALAATVGWLTPTATLIHTLHAEWAASQFSRQRGT